jgi:MoaA/NifB/PqqE/SkfB family radical SAM enzyme
MQNKTRHLLGVWELLGFLIKKKFLGSRMPMLASFKLSYRCNLSCLACPFHRRAQEENSHMTWATAMQSLDDLHRRGTKIVVFEGGEPFLWEDGQYDLHDLVSYAKRYFPCVAVTTNGTYPLNVSADTIWVSIDGLKETHDRLRSGSFVRVFANLRATVHPRVMVHFTMHRENWQELPPLAALLKTIPSVKGMTVQLFYPYDQGESALALPPGERRLALENAIRVKKIFPLINSERALRGMMDNSWSCRDDLLINVDPDGTITQGCYVKSRGEVRCRECGFTPVAEASHALNLQPSSLLAGWRAYFA